MLISSLTWKEALQISKWRYEEPYSLYNSDDSPEGIEEFLNGSYFVAKDSDERIIGYFCFGESAQVPAAKENGLYQEPAIDFGLGMNPNLTGNGRGLDFFLQGIQFCLQQFNPSIIRLSVAKFNKRAITIYHRAGFVAQASFVNKDIPFLVMTYDITKWKKEHLIKKEEGMIELEYFTKEDFQTLLGWAESPEFVMQWAGPAFSFPLTLEQLNDYLENANHQGTDTYVFKAVDRNSNEMVGHISLGRIDRQHETGRIGKVLVGPPEARGKGIGKIMVEKVLQLAFNELQLNRVSLAVFDFNISAIKSYESAGFKKEGWMREVRKVNGAYWSSYEMGILKNEWERQKLSL